MKIFDQYGRLVVANSGVALSVIEEEFALASGKLYLKQNGQWYRLHLQSVDNVRQIVPDENPTVLT